VLDEPFVDYAATRRVGQHAAVVAHEEPLVNPFVNDYQGQFWSLGILCVELLNGFLELGNFDANDSITLGVTHTISVDHKVRRHLSAVLFLESIDSKLQGVLQFLVDNLLASLLHEIVRIILSEVRVGRGGETHD